jgi:hypothetical protein
MGQPNDTGGAAVVQLKTFSLDRSPVPTPDDLEIFSSTGVEAVFRWWLESNRRWTERNGTKATMPTATPDAPPQR